jgi:hypothetical protein
VLHPPVDAAEPPRAAVTEDGRPAPRLAPRGCDPGLFPAAAGRPLRLGHLLPKSGGSGLWGPQYLSEPNERRTTLDQLGRQVQWVHSYVIRDRVYLVYRVPNEPFEPTTVE